MSARGIAFTSIHYPLVHTAMSAPTERYRRMPGLTPEQAAEWLVHAIATRPVRMVPTTPQPSARSACSRPAR